MADNDTRTPQLKPQQRRAIAALLTERDIRAAAIKAEVSERALYRWLDLPDFKAELQTASRQAIDTAILRLSELTGQAVDTLRDVMTDKATSAGTRVQAANIALARLLDLRELQELEERLQRIEKELNL
ncbi:MAG TPA: hypothetical protein VGK00_06175 [Anaerolineales bacterium]|jgi:5-methylthioribose kinase